MDLTCFPRTASSITSNVVIAPRLGHPPGAARFFGRCGPFTTARRSTLHRARDLPSARMDHVESRYVAKETTEGKVEGGGDVRQLISKRTMRSRIRRQAKRRR